MKPVLPTYVLVANRTGATLFRTQGPHLAPEFVQRFEHPEGRLKSGAFDTDRPGRAFDRMGGNRHAFSTEESAADRVAHAFVRKLAEHLDHARERGEFDQLGLIAPPRTLGLLREALAKPTRDLVYGELAKDLDAPEPAELIPYLEQLASK
jgi:protein required for attachment to host cells